MQVHQYINDIKAAVRSATAWFKINFPQGATGRDLVLFDVDETVLSNFDVTYLFQCPPSTLHPSSCPKALQAPRFVVYSWPFKSIGDALVGDS